VRSAPVRVVRAVVALILAIGALGTVAAPAAAATGDIQVVVAVPITVPVQQSGLIAAAELEQYTSPVGLLTRQLDAVAGRPVTLAIDPMIIVSIRLLGTQAPPSALAWLAQLAAVSNEVVPLPFSDSDLTLPIQAGSPVPLEPQSLDFAIDPTRFAAAGEPTATPAPTAEPVVPTLPTSDDLFAWDWDVEGLAWPRDNSVIATDLAPLATAGSTAIVLASGNVDRAADAGALVDLGALTGVVADDTVSEALRSAAGAPTAPEVQAAVTQLVSTISAAAAPQPGTATVVALMDRRLPSNTPGLAPALTALASTPGIDLVGFESVLQGDASSATIIDRPQDPEAVAVVSRLLEAETAEARFATITADPLRLTSDRRLQLLALLSQERQIPDAAWVTATEAFLEESVDIRDSVQVVEASGFNLLADNAALPIAVSNELNQAVTVYITVRPDTGLLAVGNSRVELTIEPNAQGRGEIPVQAISNGTVTVDISLTGATGVPVGRTTTAEINVQAGWETPIVVVLAGIVVLVFGVGIVRNILRRRRPDVEPEGD
jgi:hypothetical protein